MLRTSRKHKDTSQRRDMLRTSRKHKDTNQRTDMLLTSRKHRDNHQRRDMPWSGQRERGHRKHPEHQRKSFGAHQCPHKIGLRRGPLAKNARARTRANPP